MPAVGAWLATAAFPAAFGTAITYATIVKTALVVGVGLYSRRQQKKARAAALDSIKDRAFMARSAVATRPIAYGRCRLSGPFRPVGTHGVIGEMFSFTVSLAGPIDAVEEVWFGDQALGTLDANGWTQSGSAYYKTRTTPAVHSVTVSASATITLPHLAASFPNVSAPVGSASWSNLIAGDPVTSEDQFSVATVGGVSVLTFHSNFIGTAITVNYKYVSGEAKARALAFLGQPGQAADPYLLGQFPTIWTTDHRSDGASYLSCSLAYDPDIYPTGVPNVSAIVRGKRLYDPRSGTSQWSRNPALIARDYLISEFGCDSSEIDDTSVIAAANACDEAVYTDGVATQARYTFDGALDSGTNRLQNLETILASMVGSAVFSAGKWTIKAGVWQAATLALDENDLANGEISVSAFMPRRDLFNGVRGTYTEPTTYQPTDFPAYTSSTYLAQDGDDEVIQDVELPMVTDAQRAQRIAKLMLFKSRQALTFSASWNLGAYEVTPGDSCEITIGRYGWTDKVFRCVDREFDPAGGVKLTFVEDAEAIYAWYYSEATNPDPAPNTDLPSVRTVETPVLTFGSGLAFATLLADGSIRPFLRVYWQEFDATVEQVELMWRRAHETVWQREVRDAELRSFDIYGVSGSETMIVQGRAINGIGVRSEWAVHAVDVDTEAPVNFIGPGMIGTEMIEASAATDVYQYDYTGPAITVGHVSVAGTGGTEILDRILITNDTDVPVTAIITGQAYLTVTGRGQGAYLAIKRQSNSNDVRIDMESPPWNWGHPYASLWPMTDITASETIAATMVTSVSAEIPVNNAIGVVLVAAVADAAIGAAFTSANASQHSLRIEIVKR